MGSIFSKGSQPASTGSETPFQRFAESTRRSLRIKRPPRPPRDGEQPENCEQPQQLNAVKQRPVLPTSFKQTSGESGPTSSQQTSSSSPSSPPQTTDTALGMLKGAILDKDKESKVQKTTASVSVDQADVDSALGMLKLAIVDKGNEMNTRKMDSSSASSDNRESVAELLAQKYSNESENAVANERMDKEPHKVENILAQLAPSTVESNREAANILMMMTSPPEVEGDNSDVEEAIKTPVSPPASSLFAALGKRQQSQAEDGHSSPNSPDAGVGKVFATIAASSRTDQEQSTAAAAFMTDLGNATSGAS